MNFSTGRPFVEEGSHTLLGDMLDMDHRNTMSVGHGDGTLNVCKHDIRVPQWKLASVEIIVLKINNQ